MSQHWRPRPGVRLRPVPEQAMCFAYRPRLHPNDPPPALHGLNLSSWLVMELCDGRGDAELARAYAQQTGPAGDVPGALEWALNQLHALGLIERG